MVKSYENFDKPYRRGLILGLSLAELFLILLFLLLLVSMGISSALKEEKKITEEKLIVVQKENESLKDKLKTMEEILGGVITIEELRRLVASEAERKKLERSNKKLTKKNKELTDQLTKFEDIKNILEKENIDAVQLENLIKNDKELVEVIDENNKLEKEKVELQKIVEQLSTQVSKLEKDLANEIIKKDIISEQLDRLIDKGRAPPCWYIVVEDKSEPTGKRQKDVKIFDVKIENDGFIVRKHNNKLIKKEINKGNESELPILNDNDFNLKLSPNLFINKFKNFYDAGNNKLIHDYKCVFMVDVYDATSIDNKVGYKKNLKTIENLFMKYEESGQWKD